MNPIMFGRQPSALADGPASPSLVTELPRPHRRRDPDEKIAMPDIPDECWSRVKERLRAELGEAIYQQQCSSCHEEDARGWFSERIAAHHERGYEMP